MSSQASASGSQPTISVGVNSPLACRRCRKNRSYCTKERPTCLKCRNIRGQCIYDGRRNVRNLEARVAELEALLEAYEGTPSSQPSADAPQSLTGFPDLAGLTVDDVKSDDEFELQPSTQGVDNVVTGSYGSPVYLGETSSFRMGRRLSNALGMAGPSNGVLGLDCEVTTYNRDALRVCKLPSAEDTCDLPSAAKAKHYFAAQYSMIGTIFAFVSPQFFQHHLGLAYYGGPNPEDQESCLAHCQVLMILAFGKMYAVNEDLSGVPPGFEYFTQALKYLPDIHEEPSVTFCGVLALIGYYMQILNRRDAAFLYVGLAQRMAISLAMHEEVLAVDEIDVLKEQKRRTWWSIYSLDRILCVKYGHPVTMHDKDIKVRPPSRLPHEAAYCPAVVLSHYTILSRILGQITSRIYRPASNPGTLYMAAVQDILSALAEWERNIPDELRFNPDQGTVSRESVSTFLHFNHCINMTARPLLFRVVEKRIKGTPADRRSDWRSQLSSATVAVIERCISAARSSTAMLVAAAEQNLLAVFGYMDGEHAFSAAMILVMVGVALPYEETTLAATDDALSILYTMESKGNHHIRARRALLAKLSSVIERPLSQQQQQQQHDAEVTDLPDFDDVAWSEWMECDTMFTQAADFELESGDAEFHLDQSMLKDVTDATLRGEQHL